MNSTFIDTSFFLALSLKDDALHQRAVAWQRALVGKLITSEFVLLEVADDLSQPHLRKFAAGVFSLVRNDAQITVVPLDHAAFEKGYDLYLARQDKEWGLTDCISFQIMREMGVHDALTHDHHFEQAGFRTLLRQDPPSN